MKRILIYCVYDKEGIADNYVLYFLNSFKDICDYICIVANCDLTQESKTNLEGISNKLILRENNGFDSAAFKHAIKILGYDTLKLYDELILANDTVYGPIYNISDVFNKMSEKHVDFWGITQHPEINGSFAGTKVKMHLQSYFLVFKNNIVQSPIFQEFWDNLQVPQNYEEAVAFFELNITDFFVKKGFTFGSYINLDDYMKYCPVPYFYFTDKMMQQENLPFIKRKVFGTKQGIIEFHVNGGQSKLINLIKKETNYDTNLIYKNIARTYFKNLKNSTIIKKLIFTKFKQFVLPWQWKHYDLKSKCVLETLKINKKFIAMK